jgi:hypothetical protein
MEDFTDSLMNNNNRGSPERDKRIEATVIRFKGNEQQEEQQGFNNSSFRR